MTRYGLSYREYMASPEWARRRAVEYGKAKSKCLACGNRAENIHHRTYARLGHEAQGDLVALCGNCHLLAHLNHTEHPSWGLWRATDALIHQNRELFGLSRVALPTEREVTKAAKAALAAAGDEKLMRQIRAARRQERREQREHIKRLHPERLERKRELSEISRSATQDTIRTVKCPKCHAAPGQPCRTNSGKNEIIGNHKLRRRQYSIERRRQRNAAA